MYLTTASSELLAVCSASSCFLQILKYINLMCDWPCTSHTIVTPKNWYVISDNNHTHKHNFLQKSMNNQRTTSL